MKIKLKSSMYIQGKGSFPYGSIVEFEDNFCLDLVKLERAELIDEPVKTEEPKVTKKRSKKEIKKEGE